MLGMVVGLVPRGLWCGIGMTFTIRVAFRQVAEKRPKPGKPVPAVHVMLDDIKREVIEPAKTPDRDREQYSGFEGRMLDEEQGRREHSDEQKENTFELDQAGGGDVFHK